MACEFGGGGGPSVAGMVAAGFTGAAIGTAFAALDSDHTHAETWPENQEKGPYTSPPITSDEVLSGDSLLDMPALEMPGIQVTGDYDSAGVGELMGNNVLTAHEVYEVYGPDGNVIYVGRTSRGIDQRAAEHRRTPGREDWNPVPVAEGLTHNEARLVEQALINQYGLGNLDNKRNEIAEHKWPEELRNLGGE